MSDIQSKLESLDRLKELCDETEKKINGYQNDDNLIQLLELEYPKLSKTSLKKILKEVSGKKESTKVSGEEKKSLENRLKGECFLNDVNPMDNKGKFVGFVKLRHRIAQKKNGLSNG
jgi:hypothetical protein